MDAYLTAGQKNLIPRASSWRGVWLIVHAWGIIGGTMALMALLPLFWAVLLFPVAVMIIGTRQLGLAVLMHDAAHHALHSNRSANYWLSDFFCAYPVFARTDAYRHYHLKHHARTQQEDDPDLVLSRPFPISQASLRRKIIRDLTGQTGWQQRKAQFLNALGKPEWEIGRRTRFFMEKMGGILAAQGAIFLILALVGRWEFYFLLWLLPFMTWHMLATRLRNIAEHAVVPDNDDPLRQTRTIRASWWERVVLAPYWVNYHIEHHLFMWAPAWALPEVQRFLFANGLAENMEIAPSYAEVLRKAASRPNDEDTPNSPVHHLRRKTGFFGEGMKSSTTG